MLLRTFFTLLLVAAPTAHAQLELAVHAERGWQPAATIASGFTGEPGWPIPLTSRSELVRTIAPTADGYGVLLRSEAFVALENLEFIAIPHAEDEQVLVVEGELLIAGAPHLVTSDTALARQDGVIGPSARARLTAPPAGHTTLGIAGQAATRVARRIATSELLPYTFDQVFAAPLRPALAEDGVGRALLVRADLVELATETPPLARGPWDVLPGPLDFTVRSKEKLAGARGTVGRVVLGRGRALVLYLDLPMVRKDTTGRSWTLLVACGRTPVEHEPYVGAPFLEPREASDVAEPLFEDVTGYATGEFVHLEGPPDQRDIRPTMGPGLAAGDVDGDGRLDLYVAQGDGRPELRDLTGRLYLNKSGVPDPGAKTALRFQWAGDTGLEKPAAGMGALLFDADGDGDLDLYQANYGADFLFYNRWQQRAANEEPFVALGEGAFPIAKTTGWSAGLAAGDVDLDGDLDVYVTTYLVYDEAAMPDDGELDRYQREDPIAMLPFAFPGGRNLMLVNESPGTDAAIRFRDATDALGLADEEGRGMQPIFWDFDEDGDVDLYVANDVSMNRLWRNESLGAEGARGAGFKDVSWSTGMDDPRGGMGVDVGDVDADGDEDLFLTNWQLEPNALYLSRRAERFAAEKHRSTFKDAVVEAGLASTGVGTTSWGGLLFDADGDADLDLFVPNGYTSPDYRTTGICVGQPNQYFANDGHGRFVDASVAAGRAVTRPLASRAALAADFDQDGDLDLVVTANNGPLQVLQNTTRERSAAPGDWLVVRLRGAGKNPFGIGARVTVVTLDRVGEERRFTRSLLAGNAYLAGNPPELFFGLGATSKVARIEVQWPSTERTVHDFWSTSWAQTPTTSGIVTLEEEP